MSAVRDDPERPIVRRSVLVTGRVQAVGFRASCRREALARDVVGYAENRADGTVFAVFEGAADAVEELLAWCRQGPPNARVERVYVHEESPLGETVTFAVR